MPFISNLRDHIFLKLKPVTLFFFFFNLIVFFIACVVAYIADRNQDKSVKGFFNFMLPADSWLSYSAGIDAVMYVISRVGLYKFVIVTGVTMTLVFYKYITDLMMYIFGAHTQVEPGVFGFIATGLLVFLLRDFFNFYGHYLQHKVPVLWEFHKVHHSASFLNPLTIERFHPVQFHFDSVVD